MVQGLILLFGLTGCLSGKQESEGQEKTRSAGFPYELSEPSRKIFLGYELEEISGLSWYQEGKLACVQDEDGVVFLLDLEKEKVSERLRFSGSGDFEGVEVLGKEVVVVRSDGTLFSFKMEKPGEVLEMKTALKSRNDVEGLAYQPSKDRFLLACKGDGSLDDQALEGKAIYAFSLKDGLDPKPVILLKRKELEKWTGKDLENLKPSAIAVHPLSGDLFLLASSGHGLVVFDGVSQAFKAFLELDPKIFRQPEGICFSPEGTLFIASEGKGRDGYILEFEHLPQE